MAKRRFDEEMSLMAESMKFLRKDLKSIQDKLRNIKKEKDDE